MGLLSTMLGIGTGAREERARDYDRAARAAVDMSFEAWGRGDRAASERHAREAAANNAAAMNTRATGSPKGAWWHGWTW